MGRGRKLLWPLPHYITFWLKMEEGRDQKLIETGIEGWFLIICVVLSFSYSSCVESHYGYDDNVTWWCPDSLKVSE